MLYFEFQVNALEHDAAQVLRLVWSMKNTLAPINKIPPDILSLIPNYWRDAYRDRGLVRLTHVCRSWRGILTSCPLLWTRLDCTSVAKTKTHIERSKASPLEIFLGWSNVSYQKEALILTATHVGRLRTLSTFGDATWVLTVLAEHFSCPVPLLEKINIHRAYGRAPVLPDKLFNGDLSSLRELRLAGGIMPRPWRGLSNLTPFKLCYVRGDRILVTQLLDFFESVPHLRYIHFCDSIPNSSNAPAKRVVSLPHLKNLCIIAQPAHSVFLNHLSIPTGASLHLEFTFSGKKSPIPSYLPKSLGNFHNLSHITATNLRFGPKRRSVRLNGSSGELLVRGRWAPGGGRPCDGTSQFLLSILNQFDISRSQWVTITQCHQQDTPAPVEGCTIY